MPITPTYPGVYIEELPSTVHTIVGVATSVTAFVGYTKRGPADKAVEVFNFGDFERAFGSLDVDSPLSYAVQQFFLNGGNDAWIVRTAHQAATAAVQLMNTIGGGVGVLNLTGRTAGQWGTSLRVRIDRDTANPNSLFNLTVTEYVVAGATLVPGNVEVFRNLTLNSKAPTYVVDVIENNSKLLHATRPGSVPTAMPNAGFSQTAALTFPLAMPAGASLAMSVNGGEPKVLPIPGSAGYTKAQLGTAISTAATAAGLNVTVTTPGNTVKVADATASPTEVSSVHVTGGTGVDAAAIMRFGVANGGIEIDAIAAFHPAATGTVGNDLTASLGAPGLAGLTQAGGSKIAVTIALATAPTTATATLELLGAAESVATTADLRARLEATIQSAALANPTLAAEFGGATVALMDNRLVATAGGRADATIAIANAGADTTAAKIGFNLGANTSNLASYSPAIGPALAQQNTAAGSDGTAPTANEIVGDYGNKTGMFALRDVDLFNLLVLPDAHGTENAVLASAMSFCEERRAVLITDLPESVTDLTGAQAWIKAPATPKSTNAAAYFPRPLFPDPQQGYRPRKMAGAGAVAGLFARTDASRGVWKAPAGTEASLRGPTGLDVALTDMENGTLNPLGLNALRAFPVYGHLAWGTRTLVGSDQMASQWKYVPVRRVALYIEETLYRGTKWVVFEPNDGPLWAQIRLSVGTFMHGLFRQGAFQGASPRQAYLVKCDSETTTQADIDLGVVNLIVGFAPLKPAEFVVIKITQLAGQLEA